MNGIYIDTSQSNAYVFGIYVCIYAEILYASVMHSRSVPLIFEKYVVLIASNASVYRTWHHSIVT